MLFSLSEEFNVFHLCDVFEACFYELCCFYECLCGFTDVVVVLEVLQLRADECVLDVLVA